MRVLIKQIEISSAAIGYTIAVTIAAMFFYAAISKLSNYSHTKSEMMSQVFPGSVK